MRSMALAMMVAIGLAGGCGDRRSIRQFCKLPKKCDCEAPKDRQECEDDQYESLNSASQSAAEAGLRFNEDCYFDLLDRFVEKIGCSSVELASLEIQGLLTCAACSVVSGDQPEGAACGSTGLGSNCASGLQCTLGVCLDLCSPRPGGESCVFHATDGMTAYYPCDNGYCDGGSETCVVHLADGAACTNASECASDNCVGNVCVARAAAGSTCSWDGDCMTSLICAESVCRALPGLGQPCTDRCAPNLLCSYEESGQVCVRDELWVCQL